MDIDVILAREMAKGNCKIERGNVLGNVVPSMEWSKWLSYEPDFEKKRIEELETKKELSYEETNELNLYKRNKLFAKLFKLYNANKCEPQDYMSVYNFMGKESIEKLMISKLTKEELTYAKEEIDRLSKLPNNELNAKINEEKQSQVYKNLSMVDSYILHIIADINFVRYFNELNEQLKTQLEQNATMVLRNER